MGCPAEVQIGDNLVFTVITHNATTGSQADASALPAYRIYEDETSTPILTGTMALLDDANTIGCYSETVACTAANGFENGKTYSIYISATVAGITGGITFGFKAKGITGLSENAALNLITAKLIGDRVLAADESVTYDNYSGAPVLTLLKSGNAVTRTLG
jgi:hypothetical protein